jgi:hypothetical protein
MLAYVQGGLSNWHSTLTDDPRDDYDPIEKAIRTRIDTDSEGNSTEVLSIDKADSGVIDYEAPDETEDESEGFAGHSAIPSRFSAVDDIIGKLGLTLEQMAALHQRACGWSQAKIVEVTGVSVRTQAELWDRVAKTFESDKRLRLDVPSHLRRKIEGHGGRMADRISHAGKYEDYTPRIGVRRVKTNWGVYDYPACVVQVIYRFPSPYAGKRQDWPAMKPSEFGARRRYGSKDKNWNGGDYYPAPSNGNTLTEWLSPEFDFASGLVYYGKSELRVDREYEGGRTDHDSEVSDLDRGFHAYEDNRHRFHYRPYEPEFLAHCADEQRDTPGNRDPDHKVTPNTAEMILV